MECVNKGVSYWCVIKLGTVGKLKGQMKGNSKAIKLVRTVIAVTMPIFNSTVV